MPIFYPHTAINILQEALGPLAEASERSTVAYQPQGEVDTELVATKPKFLRYTKASVGRVEELRQFRVTLGGTMALGVSGD